MALRHVSTPVHGRFLYEPRDPARLLVGFHGYAENATPNMAELRKVPQAEEWSLAAVQALHPFYIRHDPGIGASWMTAQDRELAIADNIEYIRRVVGSLPRPNKLVFLGFSQGVAMAFRAAADFGARCDGIIALGGDIPPEITDEHVKLPPTLLSRGERDEWYTQEKFEQDLRFLRETTDVTACVFNAAHEWSDDFRKAAGEFLEKIK
jgi:predicted esterase